MRKWRIRWIFMIAGILLTVDIFLFMEIVRNHNKANNIATSEEQDTDEMPEDDGIYTVDVDEESETEDEEEPVDEEDEEPEIEEEIECVENAPVKWIVSEGEYSCVEGMMDRDSYDVTMEINRFDKSVIRSNRVDFSGVKMTAIGDSLTQGIGLKTRDQETYNWGVRVADYLEFREFVNLGLRGSTIYGHGEYSPMPERWEEIQEDSDIIVVMGGTNDVISGRRKDFGEIYGENRERDTFCGDLEYILTSIRDRYCTEEHYCKLIYINPPAVKDRYTQEGIRRGEKVSQEKYAEAINVIAVECGYDVIDLYNSNFLNPRNETIEERYTYDGIHYNKDGYKIFAEHIASEIIQRVYSE